MGRGATIVGVGVAAAALFTLVAAPAVADTSTGSIAGRATNDPTRA
jgi:hypothetical protein